jgi:hypothetical protein
VVLGNDGDRQPKAPLPKLIELHNRLSDQNFVWWPFLFLKLRPEESMTLSHRVKMVLCFAPYFAVGGALREFLLGHAVTIEQLIRWTLYGLGFFLVWFNVVTAPCWNRRARSLRS